MAATKENSAVLADEIHAAVHWRTKGEDSLFRKRNTSRLGVSPLSKRDFSNVPPQSSEEPHIQREIDSDKTGTIRRYLRLADELLKSDDDSNSNAA